MGLVSHKIAIAVAVELNHSKGEPRATRPMRGFVSAKIEKNSIKSEKSEIFL